MMKLIHDYLDVQLTKKALIKEGNPQIWFNATLTLDCQEIDAKQCFLTEHFTTMVGSTFLSKTYFFFVGKTTIVKIMARIGVLSINWVNHRG